MYILVLLLQLLVGALGGKAAGTLFRKFTSGSLGDAIIGLLGGMVRGGTLLLIQPKWAQGRNLDLSGHIIYLVGSAVPGATLLVVIGLIKDLMGHE